VARIGDAHIRAVT